MSEIEALLDALGSDGDRRDPRLVFASALAEARRRRRRRRVAVVALPVSLVVVAATIGLVARAASSGGSARVGATAQPRTTPTAASVVAPLRPSDVDPGSVVVSLRKEHSGTLVLQPLDGGSVRSVQLADPNLQAIRPVEGGSGLLAVVGPVDSPQVWSYDQAALHGQTAPVLISGAVNAYANPPGEPAAITAVYLAAGHYEIQRVDIDGKSTSGLVPIPDGFAPRGVVSGGIVLAGLTPSRQPTLEVWNPDDSTVIGDLGAGRSPVLMDAAGSTVAWRDADGDGSEVHLYDIATRHDTVVRVGDATAGFEGDQPTISPDGSRLAFGLETSPQAFAVGILDTRHDTLSTTPATTTPPSYFWSTDNTSLFVVDQNGLTAFNTDGTTNVLLADTALTTVVDPTTTVRNQ